MTIHTEEESQVRRYLLGELTEAEAETLEERVFTDTEYFEFVTGVEQELIRDFLAGDLGNLENKKFKEKYSSSREGLRKLGDARQLRESLQSASAVARKPTIWSLGNLGGVYRGLESIWVSRRLMTGLASLVVVSGSTWLISDFAWKRRIARTEDDLKISLSAMKQELAELRTAGGQSPPGTRSNGAGTAVGETSFVLAAGLNRGPGDGAANLRIPENISRINFSLGLPLDTASNQFIVALRNVDQEELLWSEVTGRQSQTNAPNSFLSLKVDAKLLQRGDYVFQVTALGPSGSEPLPSYRFAVRSKSP